MDKLNNIFFMGRQPNCGGLEVLGLIREGNLRVPIPGA